MEASGLPVLNYYMGFHMVTLFWPRVIGWKSGRYHSFLGGKLSEGQQTLDSWAEVLCALSPIPYGKILRNFDCFVARPFFAKPAADGHLEMEQNYITHPNLHKCCIKWQTSLDSHLRTIPPKPSHCVLSTPHSTRWNTHSGAGESGGSVPFISNTIQPLVSVLLHNDQKRSKNHGLQQSSNPKAPMCLDERMIKS